MIGDLFMSVFVDLFHLGSSVSPVEGSPLSCLDSVSLAAGILGPAAQEAERSLTVPYASLL